MASIITARKFKDGPDRSAVGAGRRRQEYRRITSALMLQSTPFGTAVGAISPHPPSCAERTWILVHGVTRQNSMSRLLEPITSWEPWSQRLSNCLIKAG